MYIPWERGAHTALPILVLASKEMEARGSAAVQISGVLLHAAWYLLRCKTLAVAIPRRLPNGFSCWDLALAQLICRSASNCCFEGHFLAAWAASRRMCPTVPNRPHLLFIIIYPAGYTQLVGRLVHGDPWAIKVGTFCSSATHDHWCTVRRRSSFAARRQHRFNVRMDPPKLRGCSFHRPSALP